MTKFTYKLSTGLATAALLTAAFMPAAFADTTVDVTDNGAFSSNHVSIDNSSSSNVHQSNTTNVTNVVGVTQSSGGNSASYNVGGDNDVTSGDATSTVKTSVGGSTNDATVDPCACQESNSTDLTVSGNGAFSHTKVKVNNASSSTVSQKNKTNVTNVVTVSQKTGKNKANNNVGGGNSVVSGVANSTVKLKVTGGANTLH